MAEVQVKLSITGRKEIGNLSQSVQGLSKSATTMIARLNQIGPAFKDNLKGSSGGVRELRDAVKSVTSHLEKANTASKNTFRNIRKRADTARAALRKFDELIPTPVVDTERQRPRTAREAAEQEGRQPNTAQPALEGGDNRIREVAGAATEASQAVEMFNAEAREMTGAVSQGANNAKESIMSLSAQVGTLRGGIKTTSTAVEALTGRITLLSTNAGASLKAFTGTVETMAVAFERVRVNIGAAFKAARLGARFAGETFKQFTSADTENIARQASKREKRQLPDNVDKTPPAEPVTPEVVRRIEKATTSVNMLIDAGKAIKPALATPMRELIEIAKLLSTEVKAAAASYRELSKAGVKVTRKPRTPSAAESAAETSTTAEKAQTRALKDVAQAADEAEMKLDEASTTAKGLQRLLSETGKAAQTSSPGVNKLLDDAANKTRIAIRTQTKLNQETKELGTIARGIRAIVPERARETVEQLSFSLEKATSRAKELAATQRAEVGGSLRRVATSIKNSAIPSVDRLRGRWQRLKDEYLDTDKALLRLNKTQKEGEQARRRSNQGAGEVTNNQSRQFSALARTINEGIVPAYATLAANVFAVSAAFEYLQRAGDLTVLRQGQVLYASATGTAIRTLAEDLVRATEAQIDFETASQGAAIGNAAGLTAEQLNQLAEGAKNASIILGRNVTDSFNRLIRGAVKAEAELLDELGIIARLGPATEKYAAALGVSASALDEFQRTQAFVNEVNTQLEIKFNSLTETVELGSNSITRFGTSVTKSFRGLRRVLSTVISPFAELLSELDFTRGIGLAALGLVLARQVIPALDSFSQSSAKAIARITEYTNRSIEAREAARQQGKEIRDLTRTRQVEIRQLQKQTVAAVRTIELSQGQSQGTPAQAARLRELRVFAKQATDVTNAEILRVQKTLNEALRSTTLGGQRNVLNAAARQVGAVENAFTTSLDRIGRKWDSTFRQVELNTRSWAERTELRLRQFTSFAAVQWNNFRISASRAFSAITLGAGLVLNQAGIVLGSISLLTFAYQGLIRVLGIYTAEEIKANDARREAAERMNSLNQSYAQFNELQETTLRRGGEATAYFGSLANRIAQIDINDVADSIRNDFLPEVDRLERAQRGRRLPAPQLVGRDGTPISTFETLSNRGIFGDGELRATRIQLQDLSKEAQTLQRYFTGEAPQALIRYIEVIDRLSNGVGLTASEVRGLREELLELDPKVNDLASSYKNLTQSIRANNDTYTQLVSSFLGISEEEAFGNALEQQIKLIGRLGDESRFTRREREEIEATSRRRLHITRELVQLGKDEAQTTSQLKNEREGLFLSIRAGRDLLEQERNISIREAQERIRVRDREIRLIKTVLDEEEKTNEEQEHKLVLLMQANRLEEIKLDLKLKQTRLDVLANQHQRQQIQVEADIADVRARNVVGLTSEQTKQIDLLTRAMTIESEILKTNNSIEQRKAALAELDQLSTIATDEEYLRLQRVVGELKLKGIELSDEIGLNHELLRLGEERFKREAQLQVASIRNAAGLSTYQNTIQGFENTRRENLEKIRIAQEDISDLTARNADQEGFLQVVRNSQLQEAEKALLIALAENEALEKNVDLHFRRQGLEAVRNRQAGALEVARVRAGTGFTELQQEQLEYELQSLELQAEQRNIRDEINELVESGNQLDLQRVDALNAQFELNQANTAELRRQRSEVSQLVDASRQSLESGLLTTVNDLITGTERSLSDAILRTFKTTLEGVAETLSRQLVLRIVGQDPLSNARRQAILQASILQEAMSTSSIEMGNALRSAAEEWIDRVPEAIRQAGEDVANGITSFYRPEQAGPPRPDSIRVPRSPPAGIPSINAVVERQSQNVREREGLDAAMIAREAARAEVQSGVNSILPTNDDLIMELRGGFRSILTETDDFFGGIFSELGSLVQNIPSLLSGVAASLFGGVGGIIPFNRGGIVTRPTVSLIGEGGQNEAVVPLPGGRSIPVDLSGAAGGGMVNNVSVNVNIDNQGQATTSTSGGENLGANIAEAVSLAVRREIHTQTRPGGSLNKYGVA